MGNHPPPTLPAAPKTQPFLPPLFCQFCQQSYLRIKQKINNVVCLKEFIVSCYLRFNEAPGRSSYKRARQALVCTRASDCKLVHVTFIGDLSIVANCGIICALQEPQNR